LEDLRADMRRLEKDVHAVDLSVAVLKTYFETLSGNVVGLTSSVQKLQETIAEQAGAIKIARYLWVIFGAVISASSVYIAYRNSK
jgi:hypothetical protein